MLLTRMRCRWLCLFLLPWCDTAAATPVESAMGGHLRWGSCRLDRDQRIRDTNDIPWPLLCVRGRANSQLLLKQDAESASVNYNSATLYGGLHVWKFISVHGEGIIERAHELTSANTEHPTSIRTKSAFVQLGNPALHQLQITAGKLDVPFGVNFRPLPEVFDEWIKNRSYWDGPDYVTMISWDNQRELLFSAGWASSDIPRAGEPTKRATMARIAYDISPLEGTRLVLSGYGALEGERRIGVAIVSIAPSGEGGVFEWVRSRATPARDQQPEPQLFRLTYRGAMQRRTRWLFEYEDSAREYRLVTLGHDFDLPEHVMFRTAVSHHDAIPDHGDTFWFMTMGLQLQL